MCRTGIGMNNPWKTDSVMPLIDADEDEPVIVYNKGAGASFLLVCDHAGRAVPRVLGDLGLPPDAFERHIAWDIGAWDLTRRLADDLGATALAQRYSRLVIDCNRDPERADAIPEVSDGVPVPANVGLAPEARASRVAAVHAPYHAAIAAELDARAARGVPTLLVSMHSFTPSMGGVDRPWRFGVLHAGNSPASTAALALLADETGWLTGDNQPYRMDEIDHTAPRHATARGLDYLELEVRQDLIADAAGVARVAPILGRVIAAVAPRAG